MEFDVKKIFARLRSSVAGKGESPFERDWKAIIICALILNVCVIVASLYVFWLSNNIGTEKAQASKPKIEAFNQNGFDDLESYFDARKVDFNSFQSKKPEVSDPSR
jgi:hypothetical protein